MWLVIYLDSVISEHHATVNMLNSLKNCTTALTSHCLIALAKSKLENVALSVFETLRVFVNTLTADEKYYLRNRKKFQNQFNCNHVRNKNFFRNFLPDI